MDGTMAHRTALSSNMEDYLEAIFHISAEKQAARAKDIADRLKVNKSSVTGALRSLSEKGYVNYAPYDIITLTDEGKILAEDVVRRHETLKDFFIKILLLEEKDAEEASCKIEHAISDQILNRLINFVEFVEICPRGGQEWIKGFRRHCEKGDTSNRCANSIALCLADLEKRKDLIRNSPGETVLLEEMDPGQRGKILKIQENSEIDDRLSGLGISSGSIIEVEGPKTGKDDIAVKVRGYHLSLRKNEAAKISVERYKS
jgi:DtxR family Mn-dependent transcriptional regulator